MTEAQLKFQIQEDMKNAMKAKDARLLGVIRLLMAAIKQREVDERVTLEDSQIIVVLDKMVKQRQESVKQFLIANRDDLVEQENYEIQVLQQYLPTPLTEAEIDLLLSEAISKLEAVSMKDMGRVMAELKPKLQGRADMALVGHKIKALLG